MNKAECKPRAAARKKIAILLAASILVNGCATVVTNGGGDRVVSAEREALKDAAAAVATTHWPEPEPVTWTARVTGIVSGGKSQGASRKDALDFYLISLRQADNPEAMLTAHAQAQLQAADALANAAESAAFARRPSMSDVAIVEAAIGDLRKSRDIYIASAKEVTENDARKDALVAGLKTDYSRAIKEIGAAADLIADRVASDRTRTIAQPRVQPSNFTGSL